jgi:4-amino-4-deoxy-L-arabinose transferase-like glycosyltransferase
MAVVLLTTATLYVYELGTAPAYLGGDEARFATEALSIASTGRDQLGNRLPLFFHLPDDLAASEGGNRWYQPLLFYLMAVTFRFLPLTEHSVRLPAVVIGVLDVLLIYCVARRLLGDRRLAVLAALILAMSPAHFLFSRQGLDYICPLPFVLGWLWCTTAAVEARSTRLSFASGAILGVGFYSYIASWVTMPLLLLVSCMVYWRTAEHSGRSVRAAVVGFGLPVLVAAVWLGFHRDMWRDLAGRYTVYSVHPLSSLVPPAVLRYTALRERVAVYWDYFNPAYLFLSGGSNLSMTTRRVGVLLVPMSVLLGCGLRECWRRRSSMMIDVLFLGLLAAPLPATFLGERYAIQRELVVLPFAVLIGALGASFLVWHTRRAVRLAGVILLIAMPVQFAYFCHDYFTDYRARSAFWFDPANFRGVAEYLIADSATVPPARIYLREDLDDVVARWRFYLAKHRREDLLTRTSLFAGTSLDVAHLSPGSFLVLYANDPLVPALLGPGSCTLAARINGMDGLSAAVILRKVGPEGRALNGGGLP